MKPHSKTPSLIRAIALPWIAAASLATAQSVLVTIAEDPGQSLSTLGGTNVLNFNDLSQGRHYDVSWDGVGTLNEIYVSNHQVFGAYDPDTGRNSNFNWNTTSRAVSTTLDLNQMSSYFGVYWAAGDANDRISFYQGNELVASYNTASMLRGTGIGGEYYGDPTFGYNTREPYAFINFFGDPETGWDKIIIDQTSAGGGMETDNYTTRVAAFDPEVDDISSLGRVVGEVTEGTTTAVDETTTSWTWVSESAAPGAPTPPVYALILFATVFILKSKLDHSKAEKG